MRRAPLLLVAVLALLVAPSSLRAQQAVAHRWELSGVPALNYDADEGMGYGALFQLYDYGGARPYRLTIQPTLFFTTNGRRDITLFVDAPAVAGGRWRVTAYGGLEHQLAAPWYGVGNDTPYDPALEEGTNPYWYRYGRERLRATVDAQHPLGVHGLRLLVGGAVGTTRIDVSPFDHGTTLLGAAAGGADPGPTRTNSVRAGLVWDTRDREVAPHAGSWADLLVQRASRTVGASGDWTRTTATLRRYIPIGSRMVLAERALFQETTGDVPFHELSVIQSSFREQEGLGGSGTLRGIPRDRYVGRAVALANSELRVRVRERKLFGRPSYTALSAFADVGRVWGETPSLDEVLRGLGHDLHLGVGGGVHVGVGESFVVSLDVGHSAQAAAPIYLGVGWLF